MVIGQIKLHSVLTAYDHELLTKWLINPRSTVAEDWPKTLTAFDRLKLSNIEWEGRWHTFAEFYERIIDESFATVFIEELISAPSVEAAGNAKLAKYARRIKQKITELLDGRPNLLPERSLFAYCLYWWNAFGKGCIFELMVFSDLTKAGIQFSAHDLRRREERYSWYDLAVLGWRGDVKTSTYFLYVARSFPLRHDFYITRLFIETTRAWSWAVLLTPAMWAKIDGETQAAALQDAASLFPRILEVQTNSVTLIVMDYLLWKKKIIKKQQIEENHHDNIG